MSRGSETMQQRLVDQLKTEIWNLRDGSSGSVRKAKGGKGGKGGGRAGNGAGPSRDNSGPRMPLELIGMSATTSDGSPFCSNYNVDGLQQGKAGQALPKRLPRVLSSWVWKAGSRQQGARHGLTASRAGVRQPRPTGFEKKSGC